MGHWVEGVEGVEGEEVLLTPNYFLYPNPFLFLEQNPKLYCHFIDVA